MEKLVRLFELHPKMIETGRASVLDIDLDKLTTLQTTDRRYKPVNRFPSSALDLSVVAGLRELVGTIQKHLIAAAGSGLEHIEFVCQYAGPPLPEGKKSMSFRLTVGAPNRTMSSSIIESMRAHGYDLRV